MIAEELIMVGGVTNPRTVEHIEARNHPASPALPAVHEDDASSPPVTAGG